jgi:Domain of unknown function (DUF1707)
MLAGRPEPSPEEEGANGARIAARPYTVESPMRVSDAERQRAIDELRRHCGAGRIDMDEYSARLERALAATTLAELDDLLADLPIVRIPDPAGVRPSASSPSSAGSALARVGRFGSDDADDSYSGKGRAVAKRLGTTGVVVLTVVMVLAAVVLALAASWAWAAVLLVGWFIGVIQGWLGGLRGGGR